MLPMVSNELGKVHLRAIMSWATALGGSVGSVGLSLWGLRADLSWEVENASAVWDLGVFKNQFGSDVRA